jgi:hypothetical protein
MGLQWMSTEEVPSALGQHQQTNTFQLSIISQGNFDPERSDIARAAYEAVTNLVNNRAGGGVLPLIRANATLNGLAINSIPRNFKIDLLTAGDPASTSALFTCEIVALGRIYV